MILDYTSVTMLQKYFSMNKDCCWGKYVQQFREQVSSQRKKNEPMQQQKFWEQVNRIISHWNSIPENP